MTGHRGSQALRDAGLDERVLARFQTLRPAIEGEMPVARLARERGIPLRTLRRWLAAYRRDGLAGLARQPRSDRGRGRLRPELRRLIEGFAAGAARPPAAAVHRLAAAMAAEHGWPSPCYGTVYTLLRRGGPGSERTG